MSIALVVTRGFGNGTFNGTIKDVVLRGYSIGQVIITTDSTFGVIGLIDQTGQGNTGRILTRPLAVSGMIYDTFGVSGTIDETGQGNTGRIDTRPTTVKGDI